MPKALYRVREVAEILSLSKSQVYDLVKEGELTGHNIRPGHKGLRIVAKSIEIYIQKYEVPVEFWQR